MTTYNLKDINTVNLITAMADKDKLLVLQGGDIKQITWLNTLPLFKEVDALSTIATSDTILVMDNSLVIPTVKQITPGNLIKDTVFTDPAVDTGVVYYDSGTGLYTTDSTITWDGEVFQIVNNVGLSDSAYIKLVSGEDSTNSSIIFSNGGVDFFTIKADLNNEYFYISSYVDDIITISEVGEVSLNLLLRIGDSRTMGAAEILSMYNATGAAQCYLKSGDSIATLILDGYATADGEVAAISLRNASDSIAIISAEREGANDAAALYFYTQATGGSATKRMYITSTGNMVLVNASNVSFTIDSEADTDLIIDSNDTTGTSTITLGSNTSLQTDITFDSSTGDFTIGADVANLVFSSTNGEIEFNTGNADVDFWIHGTTSTRGLKYDAGNDYGRFYGYLSCGNLAYDSDLQFMVNGNGRVGLSETTGNATVKTTQGQLYVKDADGLLYYYSSNTDSGGAEYALCTGGGGTPGGSNTQIQYNNSGAFGGAATFVWIAASGRVGIGTTSPGSILHITQSGGVLTLDTAAAAQSFSIYFKDNGTNKWAIEKGAANYLGIYSFTLTAYPLFISASGFIGLNVTAPDARLHVLTASSGTFTPATAADELLLENSTDVGMTLVCPDANVSSIYFGTPSDNDGAIIKWDYTNNAMTLGTNKANSDIVFIAEGSTRARIDSEGTMSWSAEYNNGNFTGTGTINLNNGNFQKATLTGNVTISFTAAASPTVVYFRAIQDGTGGRTITWSGATGAGGVAPANSTGASEEDLYCILYNGTDYIITIVPRI